MAQPTDPALWRYVKDKYKEGTRGGPAGVWTPQKMALARHRYEVQGGAWRDNDLPPANAPGDPATAGQSGVSEPSGPVAKAHADVHATAPAPESLLEKLVKHLGPRDRRRPRTPAGHAHRQPTHARGVGSGGSGGSGGSSEPVDRSGGGAATAIAGDTSEPERQYGEPAQPEDTRPKGPRSPGSTVGQSATVDPSVKKPFAEVRDAIGIIDRLHGDGSLDNIPITNKPKPGREGSYSSYMMDRRSKDIRIKQSGKHKRMTTAHEVGHWLDNMALGGERGFESARADRDQPMYSMNTPPEVKARLDAERAAFRELMGAINDSPLIGRIRDMRRTVSVPKAYRKHASYLLDPEEKFARAYAQWVADRGDSEEMRREKDNLRDSMADHQYEVGMVWPDEEYEPIGRAMDNLMRTKGWIE